MRLRQSSAVVVQPATQCLFTRVEAQHPYPWQRTILRRSCTFEALNL